MKRQLLPQLVAKLLGIRTVASREEAPPALIQSPPHGSFTLRAVRSSQSVSAGNRQPRLAPAARECAPDRLRLTRSLRSSRPLGNSFLDIDLGSCLASDSHPLEPTAVQYGSHNSPAPHPKR